MSFYYRTMSILLKMRYFEELICGQEGDVENHSPQPYAYHKGKALFINTIQDCLFSTKSQ